MYPGKGTFVPADFNERSPQEQEALDQEVQDFLAWKRKTELEAYESAYEQFKADGGSFEVDDVELFMLAFPDLQKWYQLREELKVIG
jgi:hypothetical protein